MKQNGPTLNVTESLYAFLAIYYIFSRWTFPYLNLPNFMVAKMLAFMQLILVTPNQTDHTD